MSSTDLYVKYTILQRDIQKPSLNSASICLFTAHGPQSSVVPQVAGPRPALLTHLTVGSVEAWLAPAEVPAKHIPSSGGTDDLT